FNTAVFRTPTTLSVCGLSSHAIGNGFVQFVIEVSDGVLNQQSADHRLTILAFVLDGNDTSAIGEFDALPLSGLERSAECVQSLFEVVPCVGRFTDLPFNLLGDEILCPRLGDHG